MREIETLSPEEFLFNRFVKQKDRRVVFPESLVKQTDKVVIYGAGSVGKSYFAQNMENRYCMVVGWIDRNYLKKGYPVCSPKEIVNMSFDKIIIAIEDEDVAKTIAQDLTDLGVNKDCVLWEYPYYED